MPFICKKHFLIVTTAFGCAFFAPHVHSQVTTFSTPDAPSETYLANSTFRFTGEEGSGNDGVQARKHSEENWKGIYQAFKWESNESLSSIGFLVSPSFKRSVYKYFQYSRAQAWQVDILRLKSPRNGAVEKTEVSQSFIVDPANIVAGNYLAISFETPVPLEPGTAYAVNLYPIQVEVGQSVLFAGSTIKNYLGGGQSAGAAKSFNFPVSESDLTFYVTTVH